jgi:hypothetical protein
MKMKCVNLEIFVANDSRGFSFSTLEAALKHQIKGYVTHSAPDHFWVVAEGEATDVDNFINQMNSRIRWTNIKKITVRESVPGNYLSFEIIENKNITYKHQPLPDKLLHSISSFFSKRKDH